MLPDDEVAASNGLLGIDIRLLFVFRGGGTNSISAAACLIYRAARYWQYNGMRSETACATTRLSKASRGVMGACAGLTAAAEEMAILTRD